MLTEQQRTSISRHLRIGIGFMQAAKALIGASAEETDLRTGFSRLYYAFYHVTVGLALTSDPQRLWLKHSEVPRQIDRRLGKPKRAGDLVKSLYDLRRGSDYNRPRLEDKYPNLEELRRGAIYELAKAEPVFDLAYYEVRKMLERTENQDDDKRKRT